MSQINSFPIQTKTALELDLITNDQTSDNDKVLVYDESVGVWKAQTIAERDKSKVIPVDNITEFTLFDYAQISDRQQFHLNSFAPSGEVGGGAILWAANLPKSLHDGVIYFSPTVPYPADFNNPTDVQNYKDGVGEEFPANTGVFVLTNYSIQSSEIPTENDAIALWGDETGTRLKNGPILGSIGSAIIQLPDVSDTSYARINADETVTLRNTSQHKSDLSIDNVNNTSDANKPISTATQNALDQKTTGPASSSNDQVAIFDGATGKLLKAGQTMTQYLANTVSGPASSIDNQLALFDGSTGKLLKAGQTFASAFLLYGRVKLTGNLTLYVRTDGSDSGNGTTDTSAGSGGANCAFATWQAAVNAVEAIDINGYNVVITAGAESGTKTWNFTEIQIGTLTGGGKLYIRGNGDNTVLNASGQCFSLYNTVTNVYFGNVKLQSGGGYGTITANGYSAVYHDDAGSGPNYGTAGAFAHIFTHDNGAQALILGSTYTVSGGAPEAHIWAGDNSTVAHESNTITIVGTPTIANWYAAVHGGFIKTFDNTVTGSITGRKFYITMQGGINNLDYLTNNIPGSAGLTGALAVYQENGVAATQITDITVLGNLNGKPISGGGLYTPTITAVSGSFAIAPTPTLIWSRINGVITVSGTIQVAASGVGTAAGGILITPPLASTNVGAGSCYSTNTNAMVPLIYNRGGSGKIEIGGNPTNNTFYTFTISWHL